MKMKNNFLRRYTSLPFLLDVLAKRELTLLDPSSWEDRNDSFYIEKYKEQKKLKTVLALCFTTKMERFHHWKIFSGNSSGVCIQFNKEELISSFHQTSGIEMELVTYRLIKDLKADPPSFDELPFIKRSPYEDEGEFRVVYGNAEEELQSKSVRFDLDCIEKVILSPWLPKSVVRTVKDVIHKIPDCFSIRVNKTTLLENTVWKNIATKTSIQTTP